MKRWDSMDGKEKKAVVLLTIVQFALLIAAMIDIWRCPKDKIKGGKNRWRLISLFNFLGPITYFCFGKRRN
ncbi:MAG: PLDc N-terminal domain-containing protein [Fibrobacter sp.]|nr:PLDc N-terminal domain-containing protein [Fibrobacter sp.]